MSSWLIESVMRERIRVLHIIGNLGVGGAEKQLLGLCGRMNHSEFDLQVVCYSLSDDSLAPRFIEAGVRVVQLDKFAMPLWRFFGRLRKCIREFDPHVVHTWLYSANFWGRWAAVTTGVRAIIASDRSEVVRNGIVIRTSEWLLKRRTLRLANSNAVAQSLDQKRGVPATGTRIIRNAVELAALERDETGREIRNEIGAVDDQKIVLMVGRQTSEKNYPMFVRAADIVRRKRDDVVFVAIGRPVGDARIARAVKSATMPNVVTFVGQRDDVHRWYAAADVFCLTSDAEGFPNVVLEAMWSQCPVICTDFTSAVEVISDPSIGLIVARNDASGLATAVERLLDDRELRCRMGVAAREHVRKHYSWEALVQSMEQLYRERAGHECTKSLKEKG